MEQAGIAINDLQSLRQAKRNLRKRVDKREVLLRTNLELFKERWKNRRMEGGLKYKNVILDGVSTLLDAVYVIKEGKKSKMGLLMSSGEVLIKYLTERYGLNFFSLIKKIFPVTRTESENSSE